jgi:DNA-binding NarL/FixJ family response regulator
MKEIRVLVADDHPIVREGLVALLGSLEGFTVVAAAADGRAAVREAVQTKPDVAVLDLQMPVLDGIGATRELSRVAPGVAVLVLTMHDQDEAVLEAMRAGARGYLVKGAEQDGIARAIRAVAAIGDRLGLAAKTVANNVSSIFAKLQVADRSQAIVRARDAGLGLS